MRHIIPISGKDSLATALVQLNIDPNLPYEYVFNPTGAELPCVFDWLDKVSEYFGKEIKFVGRNLLELIEDNNYFLPSRLARYCTRQCKIEPFEQWVGNEDCIVYYGIRYDEIRGGYENARYPNIKPQYPLIENMVDINGVYEIITSVGLKPPTFFWESVYDEVCKIFGGEDFIKSLLKPWQIDLLFCWRTRANCYFCFNQKKSEWVGLMEHEPDLFLNAKKLENSESQYFWNGKDYPLTKIEEQATVIKQKHIQKIVKIIRNIRDKKWLQISLFDYDNEDGFKDIFTTTSCGLFCGK